MILGILKILFQILIVFFIVLGAIGICKKGDSVFANDPEQKNLLEGKIVAFVRDDTDAENADGVRGHLISLGESKPKKGIYITVIKRMLDVLLSFIGIVCLSPILLGIGIAIKIDDPGPVLFTQKRVGKDKRFFKLHKFRTMKMSTPHDVPTHMLEHPEVYITKVGKWLRAHSMDELPQIWDIFIGNMSFIGPRPGLWNQDMLTGEREKYHANDIKPGLTGLAQTHGRDCLSIEEKAVLDGLYADQIGFFMDMKCFFASFGVFAKDNTVVEGGTKEANRKKEEKK